MICTYRDVVHIVKKGGLTYRPSVEAAEGEGCCWVCLVAAGAGDWSCVRAS